MTYIIDGISFTNRRKLTINNNSGSALTDYQKLITVAYIAPMQTNFNDIIFAYSNGTDIPYWIESKTDSNTAAVWIKVNLPNNGSGIAGNNTVYMYYGNPTISSISDGTGFDLYNNLTPYTDHGGADWTPSNSSSIVGYHYNVGTFTITSGYTVYVSAYNGTVGYGALTVSANTINIAGTLYAAGSGWRSGGTNQSCESKVGDFDGQFGNAPQWSVAGQSYGSQSSPYQLGSHGGGAYCANGGNGGGLVRLNASGTITVSSTLNVSGQNGFNQGFCCAAGGAGGSGGGINIMSTNFAGSGTIIANGGNGGNRNGAGSGGAGGGGYGGAGGATGWDSGGGGGGRVAIHCSNKTYSGTISANGGGGPGSAGSAGTIYTVYTEPTITATAEEIPTDITADSMTISTNDTPCRIGICTVTVNVAWKNNGNVTETFIPRISINDVLTNPALYDTASLAAGAISATYTFTVSDLPVGTHPICPNPN